MGFQLILGGRLTWIGDESLEEFNAEFVDKTVAITIRSPMSGYTYVGKFVKCDGISIWLNDVSVFKPGRGMIRKEIQRLITAKDVYHVNSMVVVKNV